MKTEEILKRIGPIPSDVHDPEIGMWNDVISKLGDNLLIVDFGTGHGKSAASLALVNPTNTVVTFDPGLPYINDGCNEEQYEAETRKFIADAGAENVIFTRESSLEKEWHKEIDVLNIDSDHQYETTYNEINKWIPYVKVGGHIFFHDYEHPRCPGIKQAIDELIPSKFNLELLDVTQPGAIKQAHFRKVA